MKVVLFGSNGKLGSAIRNLLFNDIRISLTCCSNRVYENSTGSSVKIDSIHYLPERKILREFLLSEKPDTIINCSAMTDVEECETSKQSAWNINVELPRNLAEISRLINAHLIHLSSDYVFDGKKGPYTEADTPFPINYYGKTKLASENVIRSTWENHTIIRTNVLYGCDQLQGQTDFLTHLLHAFKNKNPIRVADDMFCNPTYIPEIAEALYIITRKELIGTYHISGAEYVSRFQFAEIAGNILLPDNSFRETILKSVKVKDLRLKAPRPLRAGLVSLKAQTELGITFYPILQNLLSYFRTKERSNRILNRVSDKPINPL